MPYKDPEERRRRQNAQKKQKRLEEKVQQLTGKKVSPRAASVSSSPAQQGVSAKDFDLDKLSEQIRLDSDNLSHRGSLNLRGALAVNAIALAREALKTLRIKTIREALLLLEWGTVNLDHVVAAQGQLGGDNTIPADEQDLHEALLADPVGLEHAQAMMQLHSQIVIARAED